MFEILFLSVMLIIIWLWIILHLIFDHADLNVKIDELGKLTGYKYFPSKHVWQRDSVEEALMHQESNVYKKIAIKYSDKPIRTEKDVEEFYLTLGDNFSEGAVEEIMSELTDEIYKNSHKSLPRYDYLEEDIEYPQDGKEPTASEPKKQKVCGKCIHSQEIKEPAEREFDTPVSGYCL